MNGTATREIRAVPPPRPVAHNLLLLILAAVVAVGGVALVMRFEEHLRGAEKVPELYVQNPSNLLVDVDASSGGGDGWTAVGIARPRERTTVEDVVDQGGAWRFRFRSAGADGGEVVLTRDQLESAGWQVSIPEEVVEQLRTGGARPAVGSF